MSAAFDGEFGLSNWSASLSGTPIQVSSSPTIPTIGFTRDVRIGEDALALFGATGQFTHAMFPAPWVGRYTDLELDDYVVSGTLSHQVNALNVERPIDPRSGTMSSVLASVFAEFGIDTTGMIVVHSGTTTFAGGNTNVWNLVNDYLAVYGVAISMGPPIVVGDPRLLAKVQLDHLTSPVALSVSTGNPSKYMDVSTFNHEIITNKEVYPPDVMAAPVLQADAGEIVETEIQLSGWVSTINQPVCVEWVEADPHYYDGSATGVYSVAGADGLPVKPAQWEATGGWLKVEKTPDPSVVKVMFRGPDVAELAPYRIAMTSGNFYSSLRLTGSGVRFNEVVLRVATGADPNAANDAEGAAISSPMIATAGQALTQASFAGLAASGVDLSLPVTGEFTELLPDRMFTYNYHVWKAIDVSFSNLEQSATCIPVTNLGDLEDAWTGKNLGHVEDFWVGKKLSDMQLRPLWV